MIKLIDILKEITEGKQVGTLYHFTPILNIFKMLKTQHLLPNEETKVVTTFTPLKKKEYILSIPVYATNIYDHIKNLIGFYNPGSGHM